MKKLFFSFVMLVTLVIVAGSAMAQTSTNPYPSGTYTYSVGGLDDPGYDRTVRVYLNANGAGDVPGMAHASNYTVQNAKSGTTSLVVAGVAANYFDITLVSGSTSFTFDIAYASTITPAPYDLYIKFFDGDATKCANYMFIDIIVTANNFDLAITNGTSPICQVIGAPTGQQIAASFGRTTTFTYTVTRTGGASDYDWSFDLNLDNTQLVGTGLGAATNAITGVSSTNNGSGSALITTTATGDYSVLVTNTADVTSVTFTFSIATTTGAPNTNFKATISAPTILYKHTLTPIITLESPTAPANNDATVIINRLPTIGTFSGN